MFKFRHGWGRKTFTNIFKLNFMISAIAFPNHHSVPRSKKDVDVESDEGPHLVLGFS